MELVLMLKLANLGERLPEFRLHLADPQAQRFLGTAPDSAPVVEAAGPATATGQAVPSAVSEAVGLPSPRRETAPDTPTGQEAPVQPEQEVQAAALPLETDAEVDQVDADVAAGPVEDATGVEAALSEEEGPAPAEFDLFPYVPGVEEAVFGPLPRLTPAGQRYYQAFVDFTRAKHAFPNGTELSDWLAQQGVTRDGAPLSPAGLRRYLPDYRRLYSAQHHAQQGVGVPAGHAAGSAPDVGKSQGPVRRRGDTVLVASPA
ncbi:hypothetical protein ACFQZC_00230 [Streptacidiphilus monticola]